MSEQKTEQENGKEQEDQVFNLENPEDFKELYAEINKGSKFFKIDEGVTYKVTLASAKIPTTLKTFEDGTVLKYCLGITSKGSDESTFEGIWEIGPGVLKQILESFKKNGVEVGAVFNVSKTGKGLDTRYQVNKDF